MHLIKRVVDSYWLDGNFMSSGKAIQGRIPLLATVRIKHTRCLIEALFAFGREIALSDSFGLFVEIDHIRVLVRMEGSDWWPMLSALKLVEILAILLRDLVFKRDVRVGYIWTGRSEFVVIEFRLGDITAAPLLVQDLVQPNQLFI